MAIGESVLPWEQSAAGMRLSPPQASPAVDCADVRHEDPSVPAPPQGRAVCRQLKEALSWRNTAAAPRCRRRT